MNLTQIAVQMLMDSDVYLADAREGARVGNSVVGSLLSIQYNVPRWAAEQAVREALAIIEREDRSQRPLPPLKATDAWRKLVARTVGDDEDE